jgi:Double-GTPase 1
MTDNAAAYTALLSGLVGAGKTTWLAALWQVFEEDGFESALRYDNYLGEQRYVVEINRAWTRCEPLDRTPIDSPGVVSIGLRDAKDNGLALEVPDISGEHFQSHWSDRHWDPAFDQEVRNVDALLLVVSTLSGATMMLRDLDEEEESQDEDIEAEIVLPAWDPIRSPAQVQLVEHLQFIALRREGRPLPVAVMLSAWDEVRKAGLEIKPQSWLSSEMPLLHQYLLTNTQTFPHHTFGVSAQGGDLKTDRERLLGMAPIKRLEVLDGDQRSHDLTLPLAWALDSARDG